MSITIFHNPRCGKSRTALKFLEENGEMPTIVEYLKTPPSASELGEIIKMLGIKAEALVRKQESIYKEKFAGKQLSEDEWIEAMVENPILIERPIIINEGRAVIGRSPEKLEEIK